MRFRLRALGWIWLVFGCAAVAQQPAAVFADQCAGCHSIGGGDGAGPDLKGVGERHPRAWLLKMIQDPHALIAAQDPTAIALQQRFSGMEMPGFANLSTAQDEALLDYIAQQAGATGASPAAEPAQVTNDPQAIATGRQLFLGERRLVGGGAACISCHTARVIGGLGGGHLGPDLSVVFDRLGKAKGLSGWLGATPTPIMAASYKKNPLTPDEISALTAFFQDASTAKDASSPVKRWKFVALAAGCTLLGFVVIGGAWRKRLRGVRETLRPNAR